MTMESVYFLFGCFIRRNITHIFEYMGCLYSTSTLPKPFPPILGGINLHRAIFARSFSLIWRNFLGEILTVFLGKSSISPSIARSIYELSKIISFYIMRKTVEMQSFLGTNGQIWNLPLLAPANNPLTQAAKRATIATLLKKTAAGNDSPFIWRTHRLCSTLAVFLRPLHGIALVSYWAAMRGASRLAGSRYRSVTRIACPFSVLTGGKRVYQNPYLEVVMRNSAAVIPFQFNEHPIRTIVRGEEPWFVARDVCDVLELSNVGEALSGLDYDELTSELLMSGGQRREMKLISESGLYNLIFKSRKPQAREFRKWVTSEVLPTIRKTGSYFLIEGQKKKTVEVYHNHSKSVNPGNRLGIKYTLDLTKIVAKPTPQSLEMLEKLTGISFADIDLAGFAPEVGTPWIHWFVNSCCQRAENSKTSATELYHAFVCWYRENIDKVESATPSQRLFGSELKKVDGLVRFRESAGVYYRGIELLMSEEVAA